MTPIKGLLALAWVLFAAAAMAQTVYKYQRPDGTVIYSDAPIHGARLIGRFQLVPLPQDSPAPERGVRERIPGQGTGEARAERRVQALDAAEAEIKAADQALVDAQARQRAGVEPLPGERIGNAGRRSSRLGPDYLERQRELDREVERARIRLERAYRQRNELRD